jgi:thiol-disulfide isomerase/thioredoxin
MVLLALFSLAAGVYLQRNMPVFQGKTANTQALEFSFPDVSEQMQSISQWRGKVLVVNFWATWCAPCLNEIPEFIRLQNEYQHSGLQFVGVAVENKQPVTEYLQRIHINYPVMVAGDEGIALSEELGNILYAVPFTLIVNQLGQVVHMQFGELSRDRLIELVTPLLAKT